MAQLSFVKWQQQLEFLLPAGRLRGLPGGNACRRPCRARPEMPQGPETLQPLKPCSPKSQNPKPTSQNPKPQTLNPIP